MKKIISSFAFLFSFILSFPVFASDNSNILYYGYLPGTDYTYYKPLQKIDLKGREFRIEVVDARGSIKKVDCYEDVIDRQTELEGELGINFFRDYLKTMIENCNGKVNPDSPNELTVKLEGISFMMYGFLFIRIHGLVQFEVKSAGLTKKYCADMTDGDKDSPLGRSSMATRKTASRLIVSGAARRALESLMVDLQK